MRGRENSLKTATVKHARHAHSIEKKECEMRDGIDIKKNDRRKLGNDKMHLGELI